MKKNIILAGVARSGSTLACYLLNKVANTVALHEPIDPSFVSSLSTNALDYISAFYEEQRYSLLVNGVAQSKSQKGSVPDNPMGDLDIKIGKRVRVLDGSQITVTKDLQNDFSLIIKQPGLFTGMLSVLHNHFPCYATIRNPLAILRSWNTVDMAVTDGHAPAAEQCDSVLKAALAEEVDVFKRQIILLSWYYEQFFYYINPENIIRYEEVIASKGKVLACVSPLASQLNEKLDNRNDNDLYDESIKHQLSEHLLDSNGFYWQYYSKNDVTDLLENN
jgi:hypothetical protein